MQYFKVMASSLALSVIVLSSSTAYAAETIDFDEFPSPPVTGFYSSTGVIGPLVYNDVTIQDAVGSGFVMNGSGWANRQTSGSNLFGTRSGAIELIFNSAFKDISFDLIQGTAATTFQVDLFLNNVIQNTFFLPVGSFGSGTDVVNFSSSQTLFNNVRLSGSTNFAVDTIGFDNGLTGAVPEPGTWAMLLLGLFGIGGAMRTARRKQNVTLSYS